MFSCSFWACASELCPIRGLIHFETRIFHSETPIAGIPLWNRSDFVTWDKSSQYMEKTKKITFQLVCGWETLGSSFYRSSFNRECEYPKRSFYRSLRSPQRIASHHLQQFTTIDPRHVQVVPWSPYLTSPSCSTSSLGSWCGAANDGTSGTPIPRALWLLNSLLWKMDEHSPFIDDSWRFMMM